MRELNPTSAKNGNTNSMNPNRLKQLADEALSEYNHAKQNVLEEKLALAGARKQLRRSLRTQEVMNAIAQKMQQEAHQKIAGIVSECLNAVYDTDYEFQIVFDRKRGKTEARMIFLCDGKEFRPTASRGGGVIDVAAFALRLAKIMMQKPRGRRLLVLDEPFKNINGPEAQERAAFMLEAFAKRMKVQIIMVSDDDWLQLGKVIQIK